MSRKLKTNTRKVRESKLFEWQEKAKSPGECAKCKRLCLWLTVDHIIPVSVLDRLDDGVELILNDEENFQLLCKPCNMMKSSIIDITNPKTAKLMVKYMRPYL